MAQPKTIENNPVSHISIANSPVQPTDEQTAPNTTKAKHNPRWVKGGPSYLESIQARLATLTEEQKDAIHESLQE